MRLETLPKPGTLLYDELGNPCVVVKSWPWDDRVSVLSQGQVFLVEIDKLNRNGLKGILIQNGVEEDGENRSTSSSSQEPGRGSTEP